MSDAARDVRVFDGAARADRPLPDGGRLPGGPSIRSPLATRIEYIAHPSFDDPGARDSILAEMSGPPPPEVTRRATAPEGPRPEMDGLREVPLLSREQEAHLFRQMNYLKSLAERARAGLDPDRPGRADMEEFERLRAAAVTVKQRIVRANLRLVVAVARRYRGRADELAELVSIGNLALIRAVDKFDFAGAQVQHLCHLGDPQRPGPGDPQRRPPPRTARPRAPGGLHGHRRHPRRPG